MWKEGGKRVNFFFQFFFSIVEWLGRGGQGFIYIYIYVERGWEGEGG